MEFLKVINELQKIGLSKEEFLPMLEAETKRQLMAQEVKLMEIQRSRQSDPVDMSNLESKFENIVAKLTNEVDQLNRKLDYVEQSLIRNHEQQNQLMQQQTDLHRQIQHLSDYLEHGMEALKVSLTQAVNERLGSVVDIQKPESSGYSSDLTGGDGLDIFVDTLGDNSGSQMQQFYPETEDKTPDEDRESNYLVKRIENSNLDDGVGVETEQYNKASTETNGTESSKQKCVEATGEFAHAVSYIMTQDTAVHSQQLRQDKLNTTSYLPGENDFHEVLKRTRKGNKNKIMSGPSISLIPENDAECFISNFTVFQSKGRDFFTECLYTRPKACKVRMRLWFNKRYHLGVHLLVSKGELDDCHNWPMFFSGNGFIFNQSSQSYTRLWTVESQLCSKPQMNREITLGASVCLNTSRDPCTEVTSDLLMKKRYVCDGDRLLFRWNVKAVEYKVNEHSVNHLPFY